MADNVQESEVVLRFWSKKAKDEFLGQFCDGWGEGPVQFSWPWKGGISLWDATHLEMEAFDDPGGKGTPDEGFAGGRWHAPGFMDADALLPEEE